MDVQAVLENYGERMGRLAIYQPLLQLKNKRTQDNSGKPVDMFGLGLITLLFFFEQMIMRNKKSGVSELTECLYEVVQSELDLTYHQVEEIARQIIVEFRPASGKRSSMSFYNWETRKVEEISFSILKAAKADLQTGTQYYVLDEDGLELIFATKEYFSEFQISINQLLLRKQLEKGEFAGALRQIDEMVLAVNQLYERILKIKHEVNRNITSEETYERYKGLIEDINLRLVYENEEFDELHEFVGQTKEKVKYSLEAEKDHRAYEMILKIDRELNKVHNEHKTLLKTSIELKMVALEAARQALYFIGIDVFNFEQELTNTLFSNVLPTSVAGVLIKPFLPLPRQRTWGALSVFTRQRIEKEHKEASSKNFSEAISEEEEQKRTAALRKEFKQIGQVVLEELLKGSTLEEVIDFVEEQAPHLLNQKMFYHFWLVLHQKSPIIWEKVDEQHVLGGLKELMPSRVKGLEVLELKDILKVAKAFEVQNMIVRVREDS